MLPESTGDGWRGIGRIMSRFNLWFCFALGIGVAAATLPATRPAQAATATTERATQQLFEAVQTSDLPAVQASIAAGADINARNRWGMTPTDIAIDRGNYRIAHFLVSVRNQQRTTPAHATDSPEAESAPEAAAATALREPAHRAAAKPGSSAPTAVPAANGGQAAANWPSGRLNPFDPDAPAPGAQLGQPSGSAAR